MNNTTTTLFFNEAEASRWLDEMLGGTTEAEPTVTETVTAEPETQTIEVEKMETVKLTPTRKQRVVVNRYAGMAPLSATESDEFNSWLAAHGLCKTIGSAASTKRMRIYRNLGTKRGRQCHSRDCIYVVSADQWRKHKDVVYRQILKLSQKQMDAEYVMKSREYREKMNQIEEDLLMNHHIVMNWYNGKSATFSKMQHVITAPDVLAQLDEAVKHNENYDVRNMYISRFRMGARIEELGIAPEYDWRSYDIIVKGGKVVCAYCYRDMLPLHKETFKTGLFNKLGYNTEIVDSKTIEDIKQKSAALNPAVVVA